MNKTKKKRKYIAKPITLLRRKTILEFIGQFCKENKFCPNMREIGNASGVTSTSIVAYYLAQLKGMGFVDYKPKQARTIHLTEEGELEIAHILKMDASVTAS